MSTVEHRLEKDTGEGSAVRLLCLSRGEVTLPQAPSSPGQISPSEKTIEGCVSCCLKGSCDGWHSGSHLGP